MEYEWDDNKLTLNLEKHQVHFSVDEGFDWATACIEPEPARHMANHGSGLTVGWANASTVGCLRPATDASALSACAKRINARLSAMYLKTKSGRFAILPTEAEDAEINAGIAADPDNPEWTEDDFARARPASEVLPEIFPPEVAAAMLKPRGRPRSATPTRCI